MTTLTIVLLFVVILLTVFLVIACVRYKALTKSNETIITLNANLAQEVCTLKKKVMTTPKITTLKDDAPKRKESEDDKKYLRRCAMKFQDAIAKNNLITIEEDKIVLKVVH